MQIREKIRNRLNAMTATEVALISQLVAVCWDSKASAIEEGKRSIERIFNLESATEKDWQTALGYIKTQKR